MIKYIVTVEKKSEGEKHIMTITDTGLFDIESNTLDYLLSYVNEGFTLTIKLYNGKD